MVTLSGRKINDNMYKKVISKIGKNITLKKFKKKSLEILIMGFAFKRNCSDTRNTQIYHMYKQMSKKHNVSIYDPLVNKKYVYNTYNISLISKPKLNNYDAILLMVDHDCFKKLGVKKIINFARKQHILFDLNNMFKNYKYKLTL